MQNCSNLTYYSFALNNLSDILKIQMENSRNSYFCNYLVLNQK